MPETPNVNALTNRRRTRAPQPGFYGQNYVHTNPLPAVSSQPSFSYGSPQTTLPQQPKARDTQTRMEDALARATETATARIQAEVAEREKKRAAERAAREAAEAAQLGKRQASIEPTVEAEKSEKTLKRGKGKSAGSEASELRRRTRRSVSVLSQEDNTGEDNQSLLNDDRSETDTAFNEGDSTVAEINNIINRNTGKAGESNMLRTRSVNIAQRFSPERNLKPRSAMKTSGQEAERLRRNRGDRGRTIIRPSETPIPEVEDATYNEEFAAMGGRMRSPSLTKSPSPPMQQVTPRSSSVHTNDDLTPRANRTISEQPDELFDHLLERHEPEHFDHSQPLISKPSNIWYDKAWRGLQLSLLFLKHALKNGFLAFLLLCVVAGIAYSLRNLAGEIFRIGSSFDPPASAPRDIAELADRMVEVEHHLKRLRDVQNKDSQKWLSSSDSERKDRDGLAKELSSMRSLMGKISGVGKDFEHHRQSYTSKEDATKTVLHNIQQSLAAFDKNMKMNTNNIKSSNLDSEKVREHLKTLQEKMDKVKVNIEQLEAAQKLNKQALSAFENALPDQIALRRDPKTKAIQVDQELWRHLQGLFRQDMEDYMVDHKQGTEKGVQNIAYSWQDFLNKNDAKLKNYIENAEEARWQNAIHEGIIVSKDELLDILKKEMTTLRTEMDTGDHDKYAKIISDAETAAKSAAANYVRQNPSSGGAISKYGDAMIQAALHQFSAAVLQKPDYALQARGTMIIPYLTSPSFDINHSAFYMRWLKDERANYPALAITESVHVGDCWSFSTTTGQISILLSESIFVTDVTIDHVAKGIVGDQRSAPREVEFWIKISDPDTREQVKRAADAAIGHAVAQLKDPFARAYAGYDFIRIASFTYDVSSAYAAQTFEIPVALKSLNVSTDEVSFRVLNNWGNPDFTSLYRVRVHGQPVEGFPNPAEAEDIIVEENDIPSL